MFKVHWQASKQTHCLWTCFLSLSWSCTRQTTSYMTIICHSITLTPMLNVLQNQKHMAVICNGVVTGGGTRHKVSQQCCSRLLSLLGHDAVTGHVVPNCVEQSSSISLSSIWSHYSTSKHLELLPQWCNISQETWLFYLGTFSVYFRRSSAIFLASISTCFCRRVSRSFSITVTRSFFRTKTGFRRGPVSSSESGTK